MESHGWTMKGPLNTDNIRAQDGTLAATIADSTGDVNFQRDIEARDIDARRNMTVFNNLEVQGPLVHFIQNLQVDGSATVGVNLSVGQDFDCRDAALSRDLTVSRNAYVAFLLQANSLKVQSGGPAAGKLLTAVNAAGDVTWGTGGTAGIASVPTGQSILFNTNNTVLGYTILNVSDDDVVYVTKGTIHGGQAGGAAKPGGSWTQDHTHPFSGSGVHNHKIYEIISKNGYSWASDGTTLRNWSASADSYNGICTEADDDEFAVNEQWSKNASVNISGTTGGPTGSTWRPKGRNFTLQQRN